MPTTCICNNEVKRTDSNVQCVGCKGFFHIRCANILKSDLHYMKVNKVPYRCTGCNSIRRNSIHRTPPPPPSRSVIASNVCVSNTDVTEEDNRNSGLDNGKEITLQVLYQEIINLRKFNENAIALISSLQEDKNILQQQIFDLQRKLKLIQNKRREKSIQIVGVPNVNDGNALESALKVFSDGLNLNIKAEQIDDCFLYKPKKKLDIPSDGISSNMVVNVNNSSSYIICLKFLSLRIKKLVMKSKFDCLRKLNSKLFVNSNDEKKIYINACYSDDTRKLLVEARKIKHKKKYKYLWVENDNIYMRKKDNDLVMKISSVEDLNNLL